MTTPDQLNDEMRHCQYKLDPCHCGSRALLRYEPGCTYILCMREYKVKLSGPDWCPRELLEQWND